MLYYAVKNHLHYPPHYRQRIRELLILGVNNLRLVQLVVHDVSIWRSYPEPVNEYASAGNLVAVAALLDSCAEFTCDQAAARGHLHIVRYLLEQGKQVVARACTAAALNGHLDIVRYLVEQGKPVSVWACAEAAYNGHLDIVRYLVEQDNPVDARACRYAVHNGHLDIVRYLVEQGKPVDNWACGWAAYKGHLDIVKCLVTHCPDTINWPVVMRHATPEIRSWLIANQPHS